jgi:DNA modification methylase
MFSMHQSGGTNPMRFEALNRVCPYYTMYPLEFPFGELKEHGQREDWVIDPFCGRGTTNYAARLLQMSSTGIDSNPVAVALAKAKVSSAKPKQVVARAKAILKAAKEPMSVPSGDFWKLAFHEVTLI